MDVVTDLSQWPFCFGVPDEVKPRQHLHYMLPEPIKQRYWSLCRKLLIGFIRAIKHPFIAPIAHNQSPSNPVKSTLTRWYPPGGTYRWASQWIPHWWACPPWWLPGSRRPYSAYEGHKKTLHCNICQALIGFSQRHYNISLQGLWFTKFTYPQLFINFHTTSLLLPYSIDTTLNQLSYNFLSEIQTNVPCH